MLIYVIIFFIVTLLSVCVEKINDDKKIMKYIISIFIILILAILGGVRTTNIGTDIEVYGITWFEYAHKFNDFASYAEVFSVGERGYLLLNYIVAYFTDNINVFLFIHQLICVILVYITLYRYREKIPLWLSMLAFLTLYYCRTYNYLRQGIALSIIFFGFKYVEEKKTIKYLIIVLLAAQFHTTAYIGICIYILYSLLTSKIKQKKLLMGSVIVATIFFTLNISEIMKILYNLNILSYKIYYNYTVTYMNSESGFSLIETGFKMLFILMYALNMKKINQKEKMNSILGIFLVMDIILFQIRNKISYADRVSLYFGYTTILLFPQIPMSYDKMNNKTIMNALIVIVLIAFWLFKFVFENSGEVYPYTSVIF